MKSKVWGVLLAVVCAASVFGADAKFQIPATDEGLPGEGPIRRMDWFKNLWASRREAWSKRVEADKGAVVFLGDSITQGWGMISAAGFPA